MILPRDQLVDSRWWTEREAMHQTNIDYCVRRINDGAEGAVDGYCEVLLYGWLARYSAGEDLDLLVPEMQELLAEWLPVISHNNLFRLSLTVGGLAHLVERSDLLAAVDPNPEGHATRDRLSGWIFGDVDALESNTYTDPPQRGGIIDKRIELARQASIDPVAGKAALERFVRQEWYRGSKGAGWWGSHSRRGRPSNTYTGYWCWEGAAIAHISGVDDTGLNGHKYYPYDLVHYSK